MKHQFFFAFFVFKVVSSSIILRVSFSEIKAKREAIFSRMSDLGD